MPPRSGPGAGPERLAGAYLWFLARHRTERQILGWATKVALDAGFKLEDMCDLPEALADPSRERKTPCISFSLCGKHEGKASRKGPKPRFYKIHNKAFALYIPGKRRSYCGINILGTHIDTPHIDLKPNPIYMESSTSLLMGNGHHYGGIKKYQYSGIPLRLIAHYREKTFDSYRYGFDVTIPVDDSTSSSKAAKNIIRGKELRPILGSQLELDNFVEVIKSILGIENLDPSIEYSLYPSYKPRYVGMDRSMIGGCGQDNGSSTFCALIAACSLVKEKIIPEIPVLVVCYDREEIGSFGLCGARSNVLQFVINRILETESKYNEYYGDSPESFCGTEGSLCKCFNNSVFFSCDTTAGIDVQPSFACVHDVDKCMGSDGKTKPNSAIIGRGVSVEKTPDTDLRLLEGLRKIVDKYFPKSCSLQYANFGTGAPGGGTILDYVVNQLNCPGIDIGIPLLGMHSQYEVSSVHDLYSLYELMRCIMKYFEIYNE